MKIEENQLKELVGKVKQGDYAAFEELYSISSRYVYFTCINFLGNEEDAKDVMQDAYITAYEKISSLNDPEKFISWVNKIAINHCKKVLMKKTTDFLEIENAADELTEENENFLPEEYITQKEKRKLVMDIMRNALSDIQYKTVILYYFNGLSIEEIADIMECPPGTVKYRLSIARAKIREGVDAYENKSGDKLYSVVGLPLLMRLLYEEANSIDVPDILHDIMEAVRTHFSAGQVKNADNTPDTNTPSANNPANTSKGGTIKNMLKTPKTIIAAAAAVVIIGGVAAVIATNHENTPSSDTQIEQENLQGLPDIGTDFENQQYSSGTETDSEDQQNSFDTETDMEDLQTSSDTNDSVFWLHTADWGEEKDLTGITLFNGECTVPISLDDFDENELSAPYYVSEIIGNDVVHIDSYNLTELLTDEITIRPYHNSSDIKTQRSQEGEVINGEESAIEYIKLYNFSRETISLRQAYENNWFTIESDNNYLIEFSANVPDELTEEEYYTDYAKVQMEAIIDKYGRPSYLISAYDPFLENYENNSGYILYTLVWEKEDFVLTLDVCEAIFKDTMGYCYAAEHLLYSGIDYDYGMVIDIASFSKSSFKYITREIWDNCIDSYFTSRSMDDYIIYELDDLK